jgi:hypothetical protein
MGEEAVKVALPPYGGDLSKAIPAGWKIIVDVPCDVPVVLSFQRAVDNYGEESVEGLIKHCESGTFSNPAGLGQALALLELVKDGRLPDELTDVFGDLFFAGTQLEDEEGCRYLPVIIDLEDRISFEDFGYTVVRTDRLVTYEKAEAAAEEVEEVEEIEIEEEEDLGGEEDGPGCC